MKILALEKEIAGKTAVDFTPFLEEEAKTAWELQKQGVLREIYFRADKREAVLILECDNVIDAEKILQQLPLVREKLIKFDIIPLKPYDGFERLISG